MSAASAAGPRVLHSIAGRIRVHLPDWPAGGGPDIERSVRQVSGVCRVEANPRTGNVLIAFDPRRTNERALLDALAGDGQPEQGREPSPAPEGLGPTPLSRARIPVRGLDRDPRVARRVVERLRRLFRVRAHASPLTARVVVEYDERHTDLRELLACVAEVELPDLPGEDRPAHPLDTAPLLHGAARSVGAALGLGVLLLRRLLGRRGSARTTQAGATAAGVFSLVRSFPLTRNGVRRLLGRHAADLAFSAASIVALTFARGPLGLLVTGAEGFLLWREVLARRAAWGRYESGLVGADAEPGAAICLRAGEVTPLAAEVIEGTGAAIGRDGLPRPLAPGARVSAGARVVGGPLVLQLEGGESFVPEPRPAPLAPSAYTRYLRTLEPLSLGYAALTAVVTGSLTRTFAALLLVNPRPAMIGMEAANLGAASRVLRGGVVVVGTRPDRAIRRPDVLLLDGPRVLTDGLEVAGVIPLGDSLGDEEVLALAGSVATAAGCPWGNAFPRADVVAEEGDFNGLWAVATVGGVRYALGPPEDEPPAGEALDLLHEGGYLLELCTEQDGQPLGLVALRPRLCAGAEELIDACRRLGVSLELLAGGAPRAAQGVARRAGVPLVSSADPAEVIRKRQRAGAFVALVSDSAHAAPGFAACDLAVGLAWGQHRRFPARADLLAADLGGVVGVLEAGARRDRAVRDGVWLSAAANVFGCVWGLRGEPGVRAAPRGGYLSALAALAGGWARLRGGGRA